MSRTVATAALGLAFCLLAELFGVYAFLVAGLALVLLALGSEIAVRLMCWPVRLVREPLRASAEEGGRVRVCTRLTGPRALRSSGEFAVLADAEPRPRRWLDGEAQEVNALARRRGLHDIAPSVLRFSDPFGLCERSVLSEPTRVLVLPRVERLRRVDLARLAGATSARRVLTSAAGELDDLRRADSYASVGRIHWLTTARTGTLMERRLRPEADAPPLVVLDGRDCAGADAFDAAVRATASISFALARAGGCTLLLPPERRPHRLDRALATWPRIHARLALIEPSDAIARDAIRGASVVVWVSASADPHALAHPGSGACFIVSPFPREHAEVLFTVAGCAVQHGDQPALAAAR
jgi:uncharacterized protein (DUF58 family)